MTNDILIFVEQRNDQVLPAALQTTLRDAVKMLDRGIVLESALI